jgi:hypothetical protein
MTRHGQGVRAGSGTHVIFLRLPCLPARRLLPAPERLGTRGGVSRITTSRARPNSGCFTEGCDTADFQAVKALLEELAGED